ncbi:ketopantoate reductase family protein [Vreelandella massiliensis]|uniref:ketopantoate reductase family protein n=1 Tax=Vreelandella massiliensis TaxID=1816686 RepID=UPI00096A985C|nr:2-dehydropantoate 2-reductase [Halomonas massiliensis]
MTHWILGPGAIGRLLAHLLAPHADVTLIGRRLLPVQQTLTTPEGERLAQHLSITTAAALHADKPPPPAFVHITTKAMTAEPALESIAGVIPSTTPLVLWQNGFYVQPRLTHAWPGPVLCATTTEGAYLTGEDGVVHAGRGQTFIGDLNNQHGTLAQTLAEALSHAGLSSTAVSDIRQRLWQKLAVNAAINPLVALQGIRNGELRQADHAARVDAVVKEIARIMHAEGIAPPSNAREEQAWRDWVWQVVNNTANNKASMLQDIEANRPTERGAILGPLLESAKRHRLTYQELAALDQALTHKEAAQASLS